MERYSLIESMSYLVIEKIWLSSISSWRRLQMYLQMMKHSSYEMKLSAMFSEMSLCFQEMIVAKKLEFSFYVKK